MNRFPTALQAFQISPRPCLPQAADAYEFRSRYPAEFDALPKSFDTLTERSRPNGTATYDVSRRSRYSHSSSRSNEAAEHEAARLNVVDAWPSIQPPRRFH